MTLTVPPYSSAVDLLDDEIRWIRARAQRMAFARRLPQSAKEVTDDDRRKLRDLQDAEDRIRREIDERLGGSEPIGLDELVAMFDLVSDERLIVVALSIPALDPRQGEELLRVLDENSAPFGSWDAVAVSKLLDPVHKAVRDMIRIRRLFQSDGTLIRERLVVMEPSRDRLPKDFLARPLALTHRAFVVLVGEPNLENECDEVEYGP